MGVMWITDDWSNYDEQSLSRKLMKVDNIICELLHHIGILLTFGLCCPVLAIAISTYVSIYVLVLLLVLGRFMMWLDNNKADSHASISVALEMASRDVGLYVGNCMWEVVFMTSGFFALLCWDMASDRTYWKHAVWVAVTALVTPMIMWLCYLLYWRYYDVTSTSGVSTSSSSMDQHSEVVVATSTQSSSYELRPLSYRVGHIGVDSSNNTSKYQNEVLSPLNTVT
jgi:hypothetical protein